MFLSLKLCQAISQPLFGVGTSSLDTMCFSIRSSASWGSQNLGLRMADFGLKTVLPTSKFKM